MAVRLSPTAPMFIAPEREEEPSSLLLWLLLLRLLRNGLLPLLGLIRLHRCRHTARLDARDPRLILDLSDLDRHRLSRDHLLELLGMPGDLLALDRERAAIFVDVGDDTLNLLSLREDLGHLLLSALTRNPL